MDGGEMAQFIQFSRFEPGNKKYQNVLLSWWIFFSALLEIKSFLVLFQNPVELIYMVFPVDAINL
jgi:hypothetical protein